MGLEWNACSRYGAWVPDEVSARHVWMPDARSLCDRRALVSTDTQIHEMTESQFEDFVAEELTAPACGPCLLIAGAIRREAGLLIAAAESIAPHRPSDAVAMLRGTRWEEALELEPFLTRPEVASRMRYKEIDDATDRDRLAAQATTYRRGWEADLRKARSQPSSTGTHRTRG